MELLKCHSQGHPGGVGQYGGNVVVVCIQLELAGGLGDLAPMCLGWGKAASRSIQAGGPGEAGHAGTGGHTSALLCESDSDLCKSDR